MTRNPFWLKIQILIKPRFCKSSWEQKVNSPLKTGTVLSLIKVLPNYWNSMLMQQVEVALEGPEWTFVSTGVGEKQCGCAALCFCFLSAMCLWGTDPFYYVNVSEHESKANDNKVLWGQSFTIGKKTKSFLKGRGFFQHSSHVIYEVLFSVK